VPARLVLPHHAAVEVREQVADARVQRGQREERLMPEPRQDPALGHQHARLDFRFVPSLPGPGRQDHGAGMLGELLVGALEPGLVATGNGDAALELIALMCPPRLCGRPFRDGSNTRESPLTMAT